MPEADVQHAMEHAASDLAASLRIPGFRKGKAPVRVVAARVGREALWEEAVRSHLDGWFWNAAATSGVRPVANPEVDVGDGVPEEGEAFRFTATVSVVPEAGSRRLDRARGRRARGRGARGAGRRRAGESARRGRASSRRSTIARPSRATSPSSTWRAPRSARPSATTSSRSAAAASSTRSRRRWSACRRRSRRRSSSSSLDDRKATVGVTVTGRQGKGLAAARRRPGAGSQRVRDARGAARRHRGAAAGAARGRAGAQAPPGRGRRTRRCVDVRLARADGRAPDGRAGRRVRPLHRAAGPQPRGLPLDDRADAGPDRRAAPRRGRAGAEARARPRRRRRPARLEVSDEEIETLVRQEAEEAGEDPDALLVSARESAGFEQLRGDLRMRKALDAVVEGVERIPIELARAREKLWTPEKEKAPTEMKIWTPGSEGGT